MSLDEDKLITVIVAELDRQHEAYSNGPYTYAEDLPEEIGVDGHLRLRELARAVIDGICTPSPIDTAPKDGTAILAWSPIYDWLVVRWMTYGHPIPDHWDDGEGCGEDATHWLPLPPPPKD